MDGPGTVERGKGSDLDLEDLWKVGIEIVTAIRRIFFVLLSYGFYASRLE